jgi:hypothetical protein
MQFRFEWTSSGTTRDYLTDAVQVTPELDGDEYTYADWSTDFELRRVRLLIEITALFEETTGSRRNATEIWVDLIRGTGISFHPEPARIANTIPVVPDLTHQHTLMATRLGRLQQTRTLKLKSEEWYKPSKAFENFGDFIPYDR